MGNKGFSIIEVMAAVAIVAGVGGALYRLQLSALSASQQVVTRELIGMYTDDLMGKMNAQLNFVSLQEGDDAKTSIYLEPGSYGIHQNAYIRYVGAGDCDHSMCTDAQLSGYYRQALINDFESVIHLSTGNYRLTICRDYKLAAPSFNKDDPNAYQDNCTNGEYDPMIIKLSWADNNESVETQKLTRDDNYMIFRAPGR